MRFYMAAATALFCTTTTSFAQSEFTFSLGVMQRSYSDDTTLVIDGGLSSLLSSDETETLGFSADAHLIEDDTWARLMIYADTYDETLQSTSGIGLDVQPFGVGLFGPFDFFGDFERSTSLMRFDAMQRFTSLGGMDLYGGVSLVRITDDIALDVTTPSFSDVINEIAMDGTTSMVGLVLGGRYDLGASFGPEALSLSAFGTVGVYNATHSARYSAVASGVGAPFVDDAASASETGFTGAAELGVTASYALSDMSELSLTYQAAFYGDVVNTPGSVPLTDRSGSPSTEVVTDSVLYHGLSMSYVLRF